QRHGLHLHRHRRQRGRQQCRLAGLQLGHPDHRPRRADHRHRYGRQRQRQHLWTAPVADGGSAITGYTVTSTPRRLPTTVTAPAPSATVTGLTNGTAYTFTVTATNAAGSSAASAPSNVVTPFTVPSAPGIGSATVGSSQATVTWTAPVANGGSPITGYTVTSAPGGLSATAASTATSATVPGL